MNNLSDLTIKRIKKALYKKEFSSVELTKAYLKRIKEQDKKFNAFITLCEKEALERAQKIDKEIARGEKLSLAGIPVAVKDLYLTQGIKTTAASKVLADYAAQYSATVVERLLGDGAVIIGKTNCDAWAHGSSGENSDFGSTKNPWNLKKAPGGSSSGSAVAVAASFAPFSMGTDTGGSIRLPASFTGTVGLKPTYGRVSRYGVVAMASSLDSMGHFTKTVYDSALVFSTTAGWDPKDATSLPDKTPVYEKQLSSKKKFTIGMPKEYFAKGLDFQVRKAVEKAAAVFESFGFAIKTVSLPTTEAALAIYYIIMSSEVSSNLSRYDGIRYGKGRKEFGDEAKRRIMLGTYSLSSGYYDAYYLKASKVRTLVKQDFDKVFEKVDVILGPISPTLPFDLGEKIDDPLSMYLGDALTVPINLAGVPSLAVPCGFSKDKLPIGMQIIGPQLSEETLFQIGHKYQQATDWHLQKPNL